jgi:hypothetical protein
MGRLRQLVVAMVLVGATPALAVAVPSIVDGSALPSVWSRVDIGSATWVQDDFTGFGLGPALVQVNLSPNGTQAGAWEPRATVNGPLVSGAKAVEFAVGDLQGRHKVRVVIDGAGPPRELGTLQLDRTPPVATSIALSPDIDGSGTAEARWTQGDGGLSGTNPNAPLVVERNTSPAGDDAGAWVPFATPPGGDGPRSGRFSTTAVADGSYLIRVRSIDNAGNGGAATLGTVTIDRKVPTITGLRVVRAPTAADRSADLTFAVADPAPGSGIAADAPASAVSPTQVPYWTGTVGPGDSTVRVQLPSAGTHLVAIRVTDRAGLVGQSTSILIDVPAGAGSTARPGGTTPTVGTKSPRPGTGALGTPPGTAAVYKALQRFHARRGVRLDARLLATANAREWATLLGADDAAQYDGYATFAGEVLLGPAAVRGLEDLMTARRALAGRKPKGRMPARADFDRMARALAVTLHESVHASGPTDENDFRATPEGRAFEEGFAEAATVDLLPSFARSLGGPKRFNKALVLAARRYRPVYRDQVGWARGMSQQVARGEIATATWRIEVADTWGADRWERLARAVGRAVTELRAAVPRIGDFQRRR